MGKKILIVGGVAGGASAAARLRRVDENAEIIVFEKGEYISYANCGLPYYIGEVIKEKEKLVVQTPEKMKSRFNLDIRTNSEVTKVVPEKKTVEVYNSIEKRTYTETYDKLILSPGAEPFKPKLPGIESDKIFTLRNIPDTYRIKDYVDNKKPKKAVVVGAGFIGLEVAENLHDRGLQVTIVELADHVIGPIDFDMAALVQQHLKQKKVELYLNDGVKAFNDTGKSITLELGSGKQLEADMVIMGIGVKPETKLAKDAGLAIGKTGGILTDDRMRTSDADIYAVGDAVEVKDFVNGNVALIPLAGPANKQGRIAANNICGIDDKFKGTQGTSVLKVFDMTVASTGNNERVLKREGIEYEKSFTHSASHASYYPGAIPMAIKLMFGKKDGKILGAQIAGYDGVDKRMDVIATAMRAGMTVYDLEELELSYAPPFSSAKDPVNMAGYTASNILKGDVKIFHWHDVANIDTENSMLLDVREPVEFELGTIPGSVNISVDAIRSRLSDIPKDKEVYIFCQVGLRGYIAYRILQQNGYTRIKNLSGGYKTYSEASKVQTNEGIFGKNEPVDKSRQIEEMVDIDTQEVKRNINAAAEDIKKVDVDIQVDACGLQCPGPILKVFDAVKAMEVGQVLRVTATDPAFQEDIKSWSEKTGNKLLKVDFENNAFTAFIKKGSPLPVTVNTSAKNDKTIIVFNDDLDKALAAFIIANGAAAMGRKVTMFFTFWGLNIIRKHDKINVKKDMISNMFGMMMPRGSKKLSLSKMHMGGMGTKMMRGVMKAKNINSLEELIEQAKQRGVKMVACNMSVDVMGLKKEEFIDGVTLGGVAAMLGAAEDSDMGLFI